MSEASVLVRAAVPGDELSVARVHVRAWQSGYRGLLPDSNLDGLRAEDRAARYTFGSANLDAPATIVAVRNGRIEGFASFGAADERDVPNAGALLALYVDPEAWRTGLGSLLSSRVYATLVERGYSEAVLWLLAGNERGRLFYERDGWVREERRQTAEFWGIALDTVRYRRVLRRPSSWATPAGP